jgi:hypothetical protein
MKSNPYISNPIFTTKAPVSEPKKIKTSSMEEMQSKFFKQSNETVILKKKPSQDWINQQIKEVIHNINNFSYPKLEKTILDTDKILVKCYKMSEIETNHIISNILNTKDENNNSPLFHAIKKNSIGHIQILYEYGAKVGHEEMNYAKNLYPASNPVVKILHKFEEFHLKEATKK